MERDRIERYVNGASICRLDKLCNESRLLAIDIIAPCIVHATCLIVTVPHPPSQIIPSRIVYDTRHARKLSINT